MDKERKANAPVGVFDSGVGGLTVAAEIVRCLPHCRLIYVADQAHVPYGGRPLSEVCGLAVALSDALIASGCSTVVMACNISTATAIEAVASRHVQTPILGVIAPGAEAAVQQTRCGRIGVLATEGTVASGAYLRALAELEPGLAVTQIACPAFVPLIEAGDLTSPSVSVAARAALAPLLASGVDTIVLGCTHYPLLLPVLRDLAPGVCWINPAGRVAQQLAAQLAAVMPLPALFYDASEQQKQPRGTVDDESPLHLLTTGPVAVFAAQTRRLFPELAAHAIFAAAHWHNGALKLPLPLEKS